MQELQTDGAKPSAPAQTVTIGPQVRQYAAYATILLRQSYAQVRSFLHDVGGLEISDGEIAAILTSEALALTPERERIAERIRAAPGAHYDETPWPVQDPRAENSGWVKAATSTPERILVLGRSRGKGVAEELRGAPSTQVAISDDDAAYDHIEKAHQLCWAHPHRKLRDLATSTTLRPRALAASRRAYEAFAPIYQRVRHVLAAAPTARQRRRAEREVRALLTAFSYAHAHDPRPLRTLKTILAGNIEKYPTCLRVPGIPSDNNAAERALRSLVLKRKNSFGSKTERGAHALATLWSVLTTIAARKPVNFFAAYAAARG